MKTKNLTVRLSAYSTMAASFLVIQNQTEAQTIYTDLDPDVTLTSTGDPVSMDFDVNDDGITDFIFNASFSTSSGSGAENYYHISILGQNGARLAYTNESTVFYTWGGSYVAMSKNENMVIPFDLGDGIGASHNFINDAKLFNMECFEGTTSSLFYCWNRGPANNDTTYIGFRLKSGATKYYGWMRLFVDDVPSYYFSPTSVTVLDYAFNATPNATVFAGLLSECLPPDPIGTGAVTMSTAKAGWHSADDVNHYELQYRPIGALVWSTKLVPAIKTNVKLTGLTCSTPYEWQIRTICTDGSASDYSAMQNFMTNSCRSADEFDIDAESITIYSNNNLLYVNIDEAIYEEPILTVYNNLGQIVLETSIANQENVFEINVTSGMYMVNMISGNTHVSKAIMIQR